VKSGWAAVLLLEQGRPLPKVLDTRVIQLADPNTPKSYQPYHKGLGKAQDDAAAIERLVGIVEHCARREIAGLLAEYSEGGHGPRCAGIVAGSDGDPARIANQHIRAHAEEGRLFRRVIEGGLESAGVTTRLFVERQLMAEASRLLHRVEAELRRLLTGLGKAVPGPWRADQKMAALAAWLVLERD
jgi:hypothetical protein